MDLQEKKEIALKSMIKAYEQLEEYELESISIKIDKDKFNNNINNLLKITDSKIGGYFYIPKSVSDIPKGINGNPLMLLAQLNLSDLPENIFPLDKGIIQIFIDLEDDCYGLDFENPTNGSSGHKVVYYENILGEEEYLSRQELDELFKKEYLEDEEDDDWNQDNYYSYWECSPINMGELPLLFSVITNKLSCCDNKVEELFIKNWNKLCPDIQITSNYYQELPQEVTYMFYDIFDLFSDNSGHKMLGYPCFVQSDPRGYMSNGKDYNILLFQLDSELSTWHKVEQKYDICWGDAGICNFFIKESDLKNKDFSNVLYNWDCS